VPPATLPSPADAEALIRGRVPRLPVASRPLAALAGAILREVVSAERDLPPFDRVSMDGVAIASRAWRDGRRSFRVAGTQAAGAPPLALANPADCIEAMTGAILPHGCDCVIPVERLRLEGPDAVIDTAVEVAPGLNVHGRGLDCRAGTTLLQPGTRLGAPELAVLASAGRARAEVAEEPRILVVTTGDELIDAGEAIADWQIRRSNAAALLAALRDRGYTRLADAHLRDDPDRMRDALRAWLDTHDVLVLTGGVSMGRFDHVPATLAALGVEQVFHKVAQRPGKPLWFGVAAERGKAVYALPGNPVSSLVCLVRYVLPGLAAAGGARSEEPQRLPLGAPFRVQPALSCFIPVELRRGPAGTQAWPRPTRGSGDFVSLLGTQGFVELPPGPAEYPAGHLADFHRW
jgi:molybdopterin molybdotransferase